MGRKLQKHLGASGCLVLCGKVSAGYDARQVCE